TGGGRGVEGEGRSGDGRLRPRRQRSAAAGVGYVAAALLPVREWPRTALFPGGGRGDADCDVQRRDECNAGADLGYAGGRRATVSAAIDCIPHSSPGMARVRNAIKA